MIYEFKCDSCGRRCDTFRKVANRDNPQECQCGETMRRIVSRTSFKFKKRKLDAAKEVQRAYGLKSDERTYSSAWAGETIRLPDNKKDAEDAAFRLEQKVNPELKRKDFSLIQ